MSEEIKNNETVGDEADKPETISPEEFIKRCLEMIKGSDENFDQFFESLLDKVSFDGNPEDVSTAQEEIKKNNAEAHKLNLEFLKKILEIIDKSRADVGRRLEQANSLDRDNLDKEFKRLTVIASQIQEHINKIKENQVIEIETTGSEENNSGESTGQAVSPVSDAPNPPVPPTGDSSPNDEGGAISDRTSPATTTPAPPANSPAPSATPPLGPEETPAETTEQPNPEETPENTDVDNFKKVKSWIAETKIKEKDSGLADIFERAMAEEKKEKPDQTLLEVAKLLRELPRIFAGTTSEISKLIGTEGYSEIEKKQVDIIKGYCLPVINGHITAKDCVTLNKEVRIISKEDKDTWPPEVAKAIQKNIQGYEGVMYYGGHKMFIFKETLVDKYMEKGEGKKLDIQHMLTHEISHPVVDAIFRRNGRMIAQCNEIIDKANELKDSQSMHIRNTLEGLANVDSDFEEYFNKNIAPTEQFKSIPETDRAKFIAAEKSEFERKRRQIAVDEIMTEYTAMYLQSDRSFENFVMNCLDKTFLDDKAGAFGISIETLLELKHASSNKEELKTALDKARENNPKFTKILEIFHTFYSEIKKGIEDNSSKFNEIISQKGIEDDEFGYLDSGYGFSNNGSAVQNETSGKGGGGSGFFGTLVELAKAFDEGVNPIKVG